MFGKTSRPVIGKLTASLVSGNRPVFTDVTLSPRSPLDFANVLSPRGTMKNYEIGGVGLGIVAALEKIGDDGSEIQQTKTVCYRNSSRSEPISADSSRDSSSLGGGFKEIGTDDSEYYTYVTYYGPNKKPFTRVYCDGGDRGRRTSDKQNPKSHRRSCIFEISSARFEDVAPIPNSDFLSSCYSCQKNLHGKDIYMYRGDKAFCSTECRHRQIVTDERKEKCSLEASRSADVSSSPHSNGQIILTGIMAR